MTTKYYIYVNEAPSWDFTYDQYCTIAQMECEQISDDFGENRTAYFNSPKAYAAALEQQRKNKNADKLVTLGMLRDLFTANGRVLDNIEEMMK